MINLDTPLAEVATLLPQNAAQLLLHVPAPVQESVLRMVRNTIWSLERQGHTLDPVELDAVLNIFVGTVTALAAALYDQGRRRL